MFKILKNQLENWKKKSELWKKWKTNPIGKEKMTMNQLKSKKFLISEQIWQGKYLRFTKHLIFQRIFNKLILNFYMILRHTRQLYLKKFKDLWKWKIFKRILRTCKNFKEKSISQRNNSTYNEKRKRKLKTDKKH